MGKRSNYKNLNFNCKNDYLYALNRLISQTYKGLKRYKQYHKKLEKYLESLIEEEAYYIDISIYDEWEDKHKSVSHNLLMYFVDDVSTGFSYVMFRKLIKRSEYNNLKPLEKELEDQLQELRDVRNWTFHLAQSDYVAEKEVSKFNLQGKLGDNMQYNFNPIFVSDPKLVSGAYIESLYFHMEHRIKVFEQLFNSMVNDYSLLLGQPVSIIEMIERPMEYGDYNFEIAQLSMAMQKKKYDGSKESYEKATLRSIFKDRRDKEEF